MFGTILSRRNHPRIRTYLTALVLSCLAPVWLISAYFIRYSYLNRLELLEQDLQETANILSVTVDRDMATILSALEALATSPALASGDMATFHSQALTVLKNFPDSDIILADHSGQQLVNTYKPFGSALPKRGTLDTVLRIFETGWPFISNVFKGAVTGRYLVGVDVPVFLDGQVRYDLGMTVPASRLSSLFLEQELPPEWRISILDADKAVVARSYLQEEFVGKHLSPQLMQRIAAAKHGTLEGVNLEGAPSTVSFRRSGDTGWSVVVSVPKAVLAQEIWRWLGWVLAGLGMLVVIGLGLALVITRIIARSVRGLIAPALALGRGEALTLGRFELAETNEVAGALARASELLREREAAREHADELRQEAESKAEKDVLTGAYNRLRFKEFLSLEIVQSSRYQTPLSLLMYDIDHFKLVNDTHGHTVGDDILNAVAGIVRRNIRESDIITRWGGDEFIIILPQQNESSAALVAEKIRSIIDRHPFPKVGHVTCSFGVAQFKAGDTSDTLIDRVDLALYKAKESGRNRVEKF